ncbi:MAG TPA: hypothetical protein VGK68_05330 [Gaiellaceae bacterium]
MATDERQQVGSGGAAEQAQEAATQVREQAQQKAAEVKGRASDKVRRQLDARSTEVAEQIAPFAQALHKAGDHLASQDNAPGARVAHRAGDQVEQLDRYLRSSGSDRFLGDIEGFARQRPWAACGIGVVAGFMAARFLKASSESRYTSAQRPYDNGPGSDLPLHRDLEDPAPLPSAHGDAW